MRFYPSLALLLGACLSCSRPSSAQEPAPPPTPAPATPHRVALRRFPANLGHDFLALASRRNLGPLLVGAAASGLGAFGDGATERYFLRHPAEGFGKAGEPTATAIGVSVAGLFVAGRLAHGDRFASMTYALGEGALLDAVLTYGLKQATRRERPDGSNRLSFPSGHTSLAFTGAAVLGHFYGPKAAVPAYALASAIGASRIADRAHHLSDVLAGATLGFLVGRTAAFEADASPQARPAPKAALVLLRNPGGLGLAASWCF